MGVVVRSIKDTKAVIRDGAEFTIRTLSNGDYTELMARLSLATSLTSSDGDLTTEKLKRLMDQDFPKYMEWTKARDAAYEGFVRAGVAGHRDIVDKDGKQVEFKAAADGRVSEETMELYRSQRWIRQLAVEVIDFNSVSEQERKN